MAEIGDVFNEFKKAKPPEKLLIVGSVVAVGGIAIYLHSRNGGGTTAAPSPSTAAGSSTGTGSAFGSVASGNSSVPYLPSGVNPLYDSQGNLIAFQNTPTPTTPTPGPAGPPGPQGPPGKPGGIIPPRKVNPGGGSPGGKPPAHKPIAKPPSTRQPTAAARVYTVRSGNNLSQIGQQYGESWQTIYNANKKVIGNNPNLIYPGQKLTIPGK